MFDSGAPATTGWGLPGSPSARVRWLEALDVSRAGPDAALTVLESVRLLTAWAAGVEVRALAAADAYQEGVDDDGKQWFSEEVAVAMGIDGGSARTRMMRARDLVERLP
jgi:hypothetical protein